MDINHATELLRHAEKIGRPSGDTPAVMHQAATYIEDLERKLREAEARVAELEAERTEREKQEPVAWMNEKNSFICKDPKNADFCVPLYAAPPVTAPVRLTDMQVVKLFQDFNERDGASHADLIQSTEAAVLRANGFDIQPARGTDGE